MKRKLACFGFAFAGTELFAAILPPPVSLLAAAFLVVLLFLRRKSPARVVLLGALAGLAYFGLFCTLASAPTDRFLGQTVTCTVVAGTDCKAGYTEGRLYGTLHITEIDGKAMNRQAYCESFPALQPGEIVTAEFTLRPLEENKYRLSRMARGTFLLAEYESGGTALGQSNALRFALYRLRQNLYGRLTRWLPPDLGAIEAAMLLGEKSHLSDSISDLFRTAGVSHLLAVSGLHLTLLCGFLFSGRKKHRFYRPVLMLQALVVVFYMLLTGLPVSVLRAGLVFLVALLGNWLLQPYDLLTATGAAALLMGLQNAYAPCDVGFQLSFAAVLGVQAAAELERWERRRLYTPEPHTAKQYGGNALLFSLSALQTAAFASLATLVVLVPHRLTTSGVGVLSNLLVVWMLRPALLLGMLVLALGAVPLLGPLMHLASLLLAVWLKILLALVSRCASLPMARLYLPPEQTLITLALLGAAACYFWRKRHFARFWPVAAAVTVVSVSLFVLLEKNVTRVALVGSMGSPCLIAAHQGEAVVLFRGGTSNLRAVKDYLAEHGEPQLALLVDLRQKPTEIALPAEELLTLQSMGKESAVPVLRDAELTLYHRSSGNLAVLTTDGGRIATMAGNIKLSAPVTADVFCAAGALSESVCADTIVFTAAQPKWLASAGNAVLLQGEETPLILLVPNRKITYKEVHQVALQ